MRLVATAIFQDLILISCWYVALQYFISLMVNWVLISILNIIFVFFLLINLNSWMGRFSNFWLQKIFLFLQILILNLLINLLIRGILTPHLVFLSYLIIVIRFTFYRINLLFMNPLNFRKYIKLYSNPTFISNNICNTCCYCILFNYILLYYIVV